MISGDEIRDLDPGIRDIVIKLNKAGFVTTDSGDGRSKDLTDTDVLPFAHVVIQVEPEELLSESRAVRNFIKAIALVYEPANIEAVYYPVSGTAIIMISWAGPL